MKNYYTYKKNIKHNNLLTDLINISIKGLEEMYLPDSQEFAI